MGQLSMSESEQHEYVAAGVRQQVPAGVSMGTVCHSVNHPCHSRAHWWPLAVLATSLLQAAHLIMPPACLHLQILSSCMLCRKEHIQEDCAIVRSMGLDNKGLDTLLLWLSMDLLPAHPHTCPVALAVTRMTVLMCTQQLISIMMAVKLSCILSALLSQIQQCQGLCGVVMLEHSGCRTLQVSQSTSQRTPSSSLSKLQLPLPANLSQCLCQIKSQRFQPLYQCWWAIGSSLWHRHGQALR